MHSIIDNDTIKQSKLEKLSSSYNDYISNFDCLNLDEIEYFKKEHGGKKAKKIKDHSKDINNFLINEALDEQEQGLNTTHLLLKEDDNFILGFISLCSDSIRLEMKEIEEEHCCYANIPALKIARLGIHKDYQHNKLGQFLIKYTVNLAAKSRDDMGIKFITVDCYKHRLSYYERNGFVINNLQAPDRQSHHPISLRLNVDKYLDSLNI